MYSYGHPIFFVNYARAGQEIFSGRMYVYIFRNSRKIHCHADADARKAFYGLYTHSVHFITLLLCRLAFWPQVNERRYSAMNCVPTGFDFDSSHHLSFRMRTDRQNFRHATDIVP